MAGLKKGLNSSVGTKAVSALSAFGLVGYIIIHLLGNIPLYFPDAGPQFNAYAQGMKDLGSVLYVLEYGLLGIFLVHAVIGIVLAVKNRSARGKRYKGGIKSKGGPSKKTFMSNTMIWSGSILLVFVIVHVIQFRFPRLYMEEVPKTDIGGVEAIDLYQIVNTTFENPFWVAFYMVSVIFLGTHLRHGIWSMFQSMGWMEDNATPAVRAVALIAAIVLAGGFFFIPLTMFLR